MYGYRLKRVVRNCSEESFSHKSIHAFGPNLFSYISVYLFCNIRLLKPVPFACMWKWLFGLFSLVVSLPDPIENVFVFAFDINDAFVVCNTTSICSFEPRACFHYLIGIAYFHMMKSRNIVC